MDWKISVPVTTKKKDKPFNFTLKVKTPEETKAFAAMLEAAPALKEEVTEYIKKKFKKELEKRGVA